MKVKDHIVTIAVSVITTLLFLYADSHCQTYSFPDTVKGKTISWTHSDTTGKVVLFRVYKNGTVAYVPPVGEKKQFVPVDNLAGLWYVHAFYEPTPFVESLRSNVATVSLYHPDEPPPVVEDGFPWLAGTQDILTNGRWVSGNITTKYSAQYGGGLLFWFAPNDPACWEVTRSMKEAAVVDVKVHARTPNDPTNQFAFSVNEEEKQIILTGGTAWQWYSLGTYAVDSGVNVCQFRCYSGGFLVDSLNVQTVNLSAPSAPVIEFR